MDIYVVRANDLATCMKINTENQILNLKKSSTEEDSLLIDNENVTKLCFDERLSVVNEKKEVLGEFVGQIQKSNSNTNSESLIINLNSTSISKHGKEIGMSVITFTTTNLLSYEEKWSQTYSKESAMECKTVLVSNKNNDGRIQICTNINNGELIDQTKNINLKYIKSLLTEGMNYAFLRNLAIVGFEGTIKNKTAITINGTLCKTIYVCSLKDNYKINKMSVSVIIIKRAIQLGKSFKIPIRETITILTRLGYILNHSWGKTINQKLIINKSMRITKDGFVYNDNMTHLKNNLDQDIRFKLMYLNKYPEMKIKYNTYIKNNRDVYDMIIDYIKAVLIAKPDNVLQFSIDYFEEF
ncbi:ciliogenesis-associated TTC17-interacting protein-like [Metopolophium dirhodum]|uniref:ciliogenesis-associated TTC17-interacting protein-like n=1 Tax=Metopolophium dirhodum TaxID=44670 RepID=UPI002990127D|nr:ciliogenesis-associated TTC17-interacting protein-like [Metopolophium dirhodum]